MGTPKSKTTSIVLINDVVWLTIIEKERGGEETNFLHLLIHSPL